MLIDDENIRVQYDSTAESPIMAGDALPFPFRFIEKEQVKAILLDGTKLVFNEDYTVGLEEEEEEKPEGEDEASVSSDYTSVILNIDIPIGETITLYRETDLDQTSEFPQEARFSSRKIEDALDKLTMQNQEQREALGRAMKLPLTAAVDLKDLALPNPEPNKSVKWNSTGTALVNTNFDPDTALVTTENFKNQAQQAAKDSADSAASSANSATVAGQKVNEITALHSDYMDDINTTSTNYLNQINSRGNTIIKDADAIINRVGLNMFDTVVKDHILTYEESKGLALQGTWVYKNAIAGERYGYPDFYNKCLEEFNNSVEEFAGLNVNVIGATQDKGIMYNITPQNYAQIPHGFDFANASSWELNMRIWTGVDFNEYRDFFGLQPTAIAIATSKARTFSLALGNDGSNWNIGNPHGTHIIQDNTMYFIRVKFLNNVYTLEYSLDGVNYITDITYSSAARVISSANPTLGLYSVGSPACFYGTIDLNLCTIDINGSRHWNGTTRWRYHGSGHQYYDMRYKINADGLFNAIGMAWLYGVDTENERIFLPRNHWFEQLTGYALEVSAHIEAGLPNITGWGLRGGQDGGGGGAFVKTANQQSNGGDRPYGANYDFNAAYSNPIYGRSNTVQPSAIKKLLYICVGNTFSDTSWIDTVTQVNQGVKDLEDKTQNSLARLQAQTDTNINSINLVGNSYDNLTKQNVTNCITKLPNRVNYTLENRTLTIKAGSQVIVPYGTTDKHLQKGDRFLHDNFKVADTQFRDGKYVVWAELVNDVHIFQTHTENITCNLMLLIHNNTWGNIHPSDSAVKYDENLGLITSAYSTTPEVISLPFLQDTFGPSGIVRVDRFFNGFGCLWNAAWVDRGVEGISPAGRNPDGSLRNTYPRALNFRIRPITWTCSNQQMGFSANEAGHIDWVSMVGYVESYTAPVDPATTPFILWYNPEDGYLRYATEESKDWFIVYDWVHARIIYSSNTPENGYNFTQFTAPTEPFRALDFAQYTREAGKAYINGIAAGDGWWYITYSNGLKEVGGIGWANNGGYGNVFPIPFNHWCYVTAVRISGSTGHGKGEFFIGYDNNHVVGYEYDGANFSYRGIGF